MKIKLQAAGMQLYQTADGNMILTLQIEKTSRQKAKTLYDELHNLPLLDIQIEPHRKKRSLDANAYAWFLMDRLSEKTGIPPKDIYRRLIPDVGGNSTLLLMKDSAVATFVQHWRQNGIGWVVEIFDRSKIPGCTRILAYYGSSKYDTTQMKRLIDLIVQECETQGIKTTSTANLDRLIKEWGKQNG